MEHFRIATANRRQFDHENSFSLSAVNAVALARDLSWEQAFRLLLNQAHRYALLPENRTCALNMLREGGFVRIEGFRPLITYEELSWYLTERWPRLTHGVAVTAVEKTRSKRVCALRRADPPGEGFVALDTREQERQIIELWLPWDETGAAQPPVPEPPEAVRVAHCRPAPDHEGYRYFQPNPRNNCIGDCVIRAYSAVFDVSWDEALDMVAKSNEYVTAILNSRQTYRYLTGEYGFEAHERLTRGSVGLDGMEFCARMDAMYRHGERIYAMVGSHHVVGVVPVDTPEGKRYAIQDTWDSSREKIGAYFVYTPPKPRVPRPATVPGSPADCSPGARLLHPRFGEGVVRAAENGRVTVRFDGAGDRTFSAAWVAANCRGL